MEEMNCEDVRIASMAEADGVSTRLSLDQIEAHLAACADCRQEVEEMTALTGLLSVAERSPRDEQVWPLIEQRLDGRAPGSNGLGNWRPFLVLGLLLAAYRIILAMTAQDLGFSFKLVPLALLIAVFVYLKENPFKVNSNLRLQGE
jgi:predicted anti-sigma-YlaC factor YlaD